MILYPLLGCSLLVAFWYNFFAATGEYFYHANLRSPRIPLWDRLFGTFRAAPQFAERCGFEDGAEQRLGDMLLFREVS